MTFPVFLLPLFVAHTTVVSPAEKTPPDAAQFARAVGKLANQGYVLRDLQTRTTADGTEIALVLADGRHARGLSFRYDEDTEGFSGFAQKAVAMPAEERHYLHGEELLEELSLSVPQRVGYGCADYYLDFGSRSVSLAEHAFEIELRHTTRRPGTALSVWLNELLEDGDLVDIRDERSDDGATVSSEVVFVFDGSAGVQELRVAVDGAGRASELRLLHSPATEVYKNYNKGPELRRALRRPIESLNFVFGEAERGDEYDAIDLEIRFASESKSVDPTRFRITAAAFDEAAPGGCGC